MEPPHATSLEPLHGPSKEREEPGEATASPTRPAGDAAEPEQPTAGEASAGSLSREDQQRIESAIARVLSWL